ncbi:MAG TPA: hypothetical protein VGN39_11835 [Terriglobales bacterium]|nr:hypothetical protein [Terriglobales bacterium]
MKDIFCVLCGIGDRKATGAPGKNAAQEAPGRNSHEFVFEIKYEGCVQPAKSAPGIQNAKNVQRVGYCGTTRGMVGERSHSDGS